MYPRKGTSSTSSRAPKSSSKATSVRNFDYEYEHDSESQLRDELQNANDILDKTNAENNELKAVIKRLKSRMNETKRDTEKATQKNDEAGISNRDLKEQLAVARSKIEVLQKENERMSLDDDALVQGLLAKYENLTLRFNAMNALLAKDENRLLRFSTQSVPTPPSTVASYSALEQLSDVVGEILEQAQVEASKDVTQQTKEIHVLPGPYVRALPAELVCPERIDETEKKTAGAEIYQSRRYYFKSSALNPQSKARPEVASGSLRSPDAGQPGIHGKILAFLSCIGLREPDIVPGYQRVRWQNGRGKALYDDYIEHEEGALQALQDYLNSSAYRSSTSLTSDQGHNSAISRPFDSSSSSLHTGTSKSGDIADQAINPHSNARYSRFREDLEVGGSSTSTLHLLSCMELRRYSVALRPEVVTHVTDDRHLFQALRESYDTHRGKLRRYWSLRTIHTIHFMKFAYGGPRYIDYDAMRDL